MRISDWSSDVCSSDLLVFHRRTKGEHFAPIAVGPDPETVLFVVLDLFHIIAVDPNRKRLKIISDSKVGVKLVPRPIPGFIVTSVDVIHQLEREDGTTHLADRSEERSVGKECVSKCKFRGS